jgi:hypothetical protein
MEKLTKEERHSIYVEALDSYVNWDYPTRFGLCNALSKGIAELRSEGILSFETEYPGPYYQMEYFPEIWKHRPSVAEAYWFDTNSEEGIQKRIDILEEAIKLTE